MSVDPTPRLGRAVRYFTPVVLTAGLAVPMLATADQPGNAGNPGANNPGVGDLGAGDAGIILDTDLPRGFNNSPGVGTGASSVMGAGGIGGTGAIGGAGGAAPGDVGTTSGAGGATGTGTTGGTGAD